MRMERLWATKIGGAREEAKEQAEILLRALRVPDAPDAKFLLTHAEQLLECCREIADRGSR